MISVILTACNRPHFTRLALESLIGAGPMEILVINASVDPLPETTVPDGLLAKVVHHGHRLNQSQAINRGLRESHGDRITIVEDDDTVLPGGLAALSARLDEYPVVDVAYSLPQYTDVDGKPIDTPPRLRRYLEAHPTITWADVQRDGLFIHGTATMYRRELLDRIGGWDETLGTAEEYDAHLRMLHAGATFGAVDQRTVTYRRHPGGKSQNRFRRRQMRLGVMAKIYRRLGLTGPVAEEPPKS